MPTIVVPYPGRTAKSRLRGVPYLEHALPAAMVQDVLEASVQVGRTLLAGEAATVPRGVEIVPDPRRGQGAAVAAALRQVGEGPVLVVNSDLPCACARDLLALLGAVPEGGLAVVEALDGTTNALGLSSPALFAPVYGPGSAERFRALAPSVSVAIPNLIHDVDRIADVWPIQHRLGRHSRSALESLLAALSA
jgi:2-phospho-L-lactate guanylyltransferase (CobY/MobA/RfbA family)